MTEESTTPDLEETLRRFRLALSRRDFDAVSAKYAPNAVGDGSPLGGLVYEGREAIRGFLEEWIGIYEEVAWDGEDFRDFGRGVTFDVFVQRARLTGSNAFVEGRLASVVTWADGLVERSTVYTDIDQARAAAERLAKERE
jgi:hypothetical protein